MGLVVGMEDLALHIAEQEKILENSTRRSPGGPTGEAAKSARFVGPGPPCRRTRGHCQPGDGCPARSAPCGQSRPLGTAAPTDGCYACRNGTDRKSTRLNSSHHSISYA